MEMWKALTEFTKELFGVDVEGGGLPEAVHANRVLIGSGIAASFHEATKTVSLATTFGADSLPHWRDIVAVDFSLCPNQSIVADGPVTIGGFGFEVRNFANQVSGSVFSVVTGEGLRLGTPNASNTGYSAMCPLRTTPAVLFPLAGLGIKNSTPVRAMFELYRVFSDSNSSRSCCGITFENALDRTRNSTVYHLGGIAAASPPAEIGHLENFYRNRYCTSVQQTGSEAGVGPLYYANQLGIVMPDGLPTNKRAIWLSAKSTIDGYSSIDDMIPIYQASQSVTVYNGDLGSELTADRWSVGLVAGVEAASAGRYCVIKKLRVQAFM